MFRLKILRNYFSRSSHIRGTRRIDASRRIDHAEQKRRIKAKECKRKKDRNERRRGIETTFRLSFKWFGIIQRRHLDLFRLPCRGYRVQKWSCMNILLSRSSVHSGNEFMPTIYRVYARITNLSELYPSIPLAIFPSIIRPSDVILKIILRSPAYPDIEAGE